MPTKKKAKKKRKPAKAPKLDANQIAFRTLRKVIEKS
jgi:hypothetical protein